MAIEVRIKSSYVGAPTNSRNQKEGSGARQRKLPDGQRGRAEHTLRVLNFLMNTVIHWPRGYPPRGDLAEPRFEFPVLASDERVQLQQVCHKQ